MSESTGTDGRLRLVLSGCLDIATAPVLDARLHELEVGRRRVELDLEQVTFIDLQGLRIIHRRLIADHRRRLMFEVRPRLGPCVSRLAELTGVELWPIPQPRTASIQAAFAKRPVGTTGASQLRPVHLARR